MKFAKSKRKWTSTLTKVSLIEDEDTLSYVNCNVTLVSLLQDCNEILLKILIPLQLTLMITLLLKKNTLKIFNFTLSGKLWIRTILILKFCTSNEIFPARAFSQMNEVCSFVKSKIIANLLPVTQWRSVSLILFYFCSSKLKLLLKFCFRKCVALFNKRCSNFFFFNLFSTLFPTFKAVQSCVN